MRMAAASLPSQRYALLVRQMADELDRERGWQRRVASRLGVPPPVISRIWRQSRTTVGADVLERAVRRLRLDPRFFYDASIGVPDYREYAKGRVKMDAIESMVQEYLEGEGASLPESVKAELRELWIDGIEVTPDVIRAIAERIALRHASGGQTRVTRVGAVRWDEGG